MGSLEELTRQARQLAEGGAHMPPEALQRLEKSAMRAMSQPAMRERMLKLGYEAIGSNAAELAAAQKADLKSWEKPIKATGVSLD